MSNNGGSRASELLVKACELLDDRHWHDWEAVVRELSKLVPPGIAMRRNEHDRSRQAEGRPRHMPVSTERQIQAGKRAVVSATIRTDIFEKKSDGARVYVRLTRLPQAVGFARARQAVETFDPSRVCDEIARGWLDGGQLARLLTGAQARALARELSSRVAELTRQQTSERRETPR